MEAALLGVYEYTFWRVSLVLDLNRTERGGVVCSRRGSLQVQSPVVFPIMRSFPRDYPLFENPRISFTSKVFEEEMEEGIQDMKDLECDIVQ